MHGAPGVLPELTTPFPPCLSADLGGVPEGADIGGRVEEARPRLRIERLKTGLDRTVDERAGQAGRIGGAVVRPRLEDRLDRRVGDAVRPAEGRCAALQ